MVGSPEREALKAHVRRLMRRRGMTSMTELADAAGLNPTYVRQWLSGKSRDPRAGKLEKVAAALNVTLHELLTPAALADSAREDYDVGSPEVLTRVPVRRPASLLPVRFAVQAGAWIERDDLSQALPKGPPVAADPHYPAEAQWLELVRGDSMDIYYPEGAWVHVVDAIAIGYIARADDFVTIERKREQGGLIERSLKQVSIKAGKIELWPRSRNPRWNAPLPLGTPRDEDDEVRIAALVIGGYWSARR